MNKKIPEKIHGLKQREKKNNPEKKSEEIIAEKISRINK